MSQAAHPPSCRASTPRLRHDDGALRTDNGRGEKTTRPQHSRATTGSSGRDRCDRRQRHINTIGCFTSEDIHVLLILAVSRTLPSTRLRTGVTGYDLCTVGIPTAGSDPREGVRSGQPQHHAQECGSGHGSGDVVGLRYIHVKLDSGVQYDSGLFFFSAQIW